MPTTIQYRTDTVEREFQSKNDSTKVNRLRDMISDPDLLAVVLFTLVGLLITICLIHFLPLPADVIAFIAQTS
jgi:hypothetical protein